MAYEQGDLTIYHPNWETPEGKRCAVNTHPGMTGVSHNCPG